MSPNLWLILIYLYWWVLGAILLVSILAAVHDHVNRPKDGKLKLAIPRERPPEA